jgi:hypothetical protein
MLHMLTVVAQNWVLLSKAAAFADYFLPVMPPLLDIGGICGFFSTTNAAHVQQGGFRGFFSTSNAAICTR